MQKQAGLSPLSSVPLPVSPITTLPGQSEEFSAIDCGGSLGWLPLHGGRCCRCDTCGLVTHAIIHPAICGGRRARIVERVLPIPRGSPAGSCAYAQRLRPGFLPAHARFIECLQETWVACLLAQSAVCALHTSRGCLNDIHLATEILVSWQAPFRHVSVL